MSRQPSIRSEASTAVLAAAAPVAASGRMTAPAVGQAGTKEALDRLRAGIAELKAMAVQPLLERAAAALQADDFQTGGQLAIQALESDERNGYAWYLLAIARERAGDFGSSIKCYESALALIPNQAEVANDLGRLAYRMGMKETAEKLFAHYLRQHPDAHEAANNLACAIRDQGRFSEAIDILRPAIQADPANATLWNTLGSVVSEEGDLDTSITFFDEALRLDEDFAKARYNRGNAKYLSGRLAEALVDCERAMTGTASEEERLMMRIARSSILIGLGRVAEGWDEYEARLEPAFSDVTLFAFEAPRWQPGDDLAGRSLLLVGEQGLGDEAMFANLIPDLVEVLGPDGKLLIAVEPRLVGLFQRSFPSAEVGSHQTWNVNGKTVRGAPFLGDQGRIDLWAPMASMLRRFRPSAESFPERVGYLTPDPERVAHWRAQLDALPGPKVGLLWKSLVKNGARHRFFTPFEQWKSVLAVPGVTFVNLQYGDCAEELAEAKRSLGVEIWNPPGIDLKQDLDDVAALCAALDLVVGPANATSSIAGAAGAALWSVSTPKSWTRLGTDRLPWYPQARVFIPPAVGVWEPVMAEVTEALSAVVAPGTKDVAVG